MSRCSLSIQERRLVEAVFTGHWSFTPQVGCDSSHDMNIRGNRRTNIMNALDIGGRRERAWPIETLRGSLGNWLQPSCYPNGPKCAQGALNDWTFSRLGLLPFTGELE